MHLQQDYCYNGMLDGVWQDGADL